MNTLWQAARRILMLGTLLYTTVLVVLVLLWHSPAAAIWWLQLLNIFALYLFVPMVILIPLAVLIRSWLLRGSVLLAGLLFVHLFMPSFIPSSKQAATSKMLTVQTFNVMFFNEQPDAMVSAIQSSEADVIGLQELSPQTAAAIQEHLSQTYPYQFFMPSPDLIDLGIISRYPFQVSPEAQNDHWQHVILDVDGQPVHLLNIHFGTAQLVTGTFPITGFMIYNYDTRRREQEMIDALYVIDAIQEPLIVLGDFNMSDRELAYRQFDQRLHDAYRETAWGFGFTFPTMLPMVRIDYVWSSGGMVPLAAQIDCAATGSDHCIVRADLAMDQHPRAAAMLLHAKASVRHGAKVYTAPPPPTWLMQSQEMTT